MNRARPPYPTALFHGAFSAFGLSHQGPCRPTNEDRSLIKALPEACVLVAVADGLSGGGAWAAQTVIDALDAIAHAEAFSELQQRVMELDRAVHGHNFRDGEFQGKGSTLVCALLSSHRLHWLHVGDSRLYLWRDSMLTQVTEDQTLGRFLLQEGEISAEQMPGHYSRHVMDQYIGCGHCEPETGAMQIRLDDQFLVCSDGLHRALTSAELQAVFSARTTPQEAAAALVAAAIRNGAEDDITLVVCARRGSASESGKDALEKGMDRSGSNAWTEICCRSRGRQVTCL